MNFGQNLYNWFLSNAQSLVLMAIAVIGVYLGFKREFSKLIGFLVIALIAVGLVFNASGVKDVLLQLFNKIIGAYCSDSSMVKTKDCISSILVLKSYINTDLLEEYSVGINIGDGNKIVNSNIAEKIENTNLKEKKRFYDKHPWICGILVSLFVGIILLFSFWQNIITWIEGWF